MEKKDKGNGMWLVIGLCHLAHACTYYPAKDGDSKHGHAQTTGIVNTFDGSEVPATLNFWGKYADVACSHFETGACIFLVGERTHWTEDTGLKDAAGKKIFKVKDEIKVTHFEFAGATKGQVKSTLRPNWNALMGVGRIPANLPLTDELLDALLKKNASPTMTFNMQNAMATGLFGRAKVMVNKQFIGPQNQTVVAAPVQAGNPAVESQLVRMQAMLDEFRKQGLSVPVPVIEQPAVQSVDVFANLAVA